MKNLDNTWNIFAQEYNQQVGENGDFYHKTYLNPIIFKLLGDVSSKNVLDLACGQGYFSRLLAKKEAKVTGVDISSKLIAIAKEKEKNNCQNIRYYINNSANLKDISSKKYDFIVSNMSFHDIREIQKTIKECSRVLKKEGNLIFSINHPLTDNVVREKENDFIWNKMKIYNSEISFPHYFSDKLTIYHRSIGFYLKTLFQAGFVISAFEEIYTKHHITNQPIEDPALLQHKQEFPSFLIIKATKVLNT